MLVLRRLCLFLLPTVLFAQADLLIRHARLVDGTGSPWFRGDVAIKSGCIITVGHLPTQTATRTIDAKDLVLAPGFIDIHSHGASGLARNPAAESLIRQGVTTIIDGNDGSSPLPMTAYLDQIAAHPHTVNVGAFVGQGSVRAAVIGLANRPATAAEIDRMKRIVRDAMHQGAMGLSTGLFYVPGNFSSTDEVAALAHEAGLLGGMHISHLRTESDAIVDAVNETIAIGEKGGLPTQVSHHKIIGTKNWGLSQQTLAAVEAARARGVDVTIDQYPYTASSTATAALFPQWSLAGGNQALIERLRAPETRTKIKAEIMTNLRDNRGGGDPKNVVMASCGFDRQLAGQSLADIARAKGWPADFDHAAEVAIDLQQRGGCSAIYHAIAEPDIERIMRSPYTMIASDGFVPVFGVDVPHPRCYGTFARVLGRYVRERHVITLEDAIHKMSGYPAARLKLLDRGLIRPGMVADLVLFDPGKVIDKSTFEQPHQYAEGVHTVLVNGEIVMLDGVLTGARPGQILRGPATSPR